MPWVIGFALACSAFWGGSARAQQNVVVDGYPTWESSWAQFYQQWQYWYVERQLPRDEAFRNALLASGLANTVTNFLGYDDGGELIAAFWDVFDERHDNGYGGIYVIPYTEDDREYSELLTQYLTYSTSPGVYYTVAATTYGILAWLNSHESDLTDSATTNLLTQQTTIISSNQTTIASVYEKLDELESTPTDEEIQESTDADTYTNAVPTAPLQLGSVDVDTSSMESVLDPIGDGLQGLIPTESTTKPKIVMMQGNRRAGGNVEVELDLTGLEAVTRILRVLYKVGLWVGVIGILRSEWGFWSTLGGSST